MMAEELHFWLQSPAQWVWPPGSHHYQQPLQYKQYFFSTANTSSILSIQYCWILPHLLKELFGHQTILLLMKGIITRWKELSLFDVWLWRLFSFHSLLNDTVKVTGIVYSWRHKNYQPYSFVISQPMIFNSIQFVPCGPDEYFNHPQLASFGLLRAKLWNNSKNKLLLF